jgi:methylglyoxal synthase
MEKKKRIALVAHDQRKEDLLSWVKYNAEVLSQHELYATGTTGKIIAKRCSLDINRLKSGPLGGDQQLGAMIANGELDVLIFLWDPMTPQPHDVDIKALLRMSVLYNIPVACNRSTADFIISSRLFDEDYNPVLKDYTKYISRAIRSESPLSVDQEDSGFAPKSETI